jgi:CBS domain-containing protein
MNVAQLLQSKTQDGRTAPVTTVAATATVMEAAKLLAQNRIGAVVVAGSDDRVAGILSERDIVRGLAQSGPALLDRPVDSVMTRSVVTCQAGDSIDDLMATMTRGRFRHLPVVDPHERLIGIVSIGDVVKSHVEEIVREASTLRDYITTH